MDSWAPYKCAVNPPFWGIFLTLKGASFNSTFCRLLRRKSLLKASLNMGILNLYMSGFTIEFDKCKTFINQTTMEEKHCGQKFMIVYTTNAGNHNTSDTATTI